MKVLLAAGFGLALTCASLAQQETGSQFPPEQVKKGAQLFALNCATCHGTRMRNPQWAFDLRTFPPDGHARFVDSVTNGKGNMPSWDDVLSPEDVEALWAYVVGGEPAD